MRTTLSILGICAALVMCAVSGAMNYLFMASLGKTPLEGQVLGAASAAADVLKALLPFFIAWSWEARRMVPAVSGTIVFLFFAGFSLFSAIGFAADNRGSLVDGRKSLSEEYNRVQLALSDSEARRVALPSHRPVTVVAEEIEVQRQNRRWSATQDCRNATETESRAFCAEYFRLRSELAAAQESEILSAHIISLQAQSGKLRENRAEQDIDPQVSLLSRITGRDVESVQLTLTIAVALLVEIGASLGLFLASGHRAGLQSRCATPAANKPIGSIEDFCLKGLIPMKGANFSLKTLFMGYQQWCKDGGLQALPEAIFRREFDLLCGAVGLKVRQGVLHDIALI